MINSSIWRRSGYDFYELSINAIWLVPNLKRYLCLVAVELYHFDAERNFLFGHSSPFMSKDRHT